MDLSPFFGERTQTRSRAAGIEYTAQAASPIVSGEVRMTISDRALSAIALFDAAEIAFAEINAIELKDYIITVFTDCADYSFSRMGNWCLPFYNALCGAYNEAVLRSLFIRGGPLLTANGVYSVDADGVRFSCKAPVYVYEDCVVALPTDSMNPVMTHRVPLCFVSNMEKGDYSLTLRLDSGESYTYAKLGFDTDVFANAVEKQIRALREKTVKQVRDIDAELPVAQASRLANLVPQGAAAPIGQLAGVAPTFIAELEKRIGATRVAESYGVFRELCDPSQIWVGLREAGNEQTAVSPSGGNEQSQSATTLWFIAPSPDGQFAAVEFAEADSATFIYRTGGDFAGFARKLNRALEATDFRREVIRLSDEELRKPENADYYMAAKRTGAMQFIRGNFIGRVIHSGVDSWKRKLIEYWHGGV